MHLIDSIDDLTSSEFSENLEIISINIHLPKPCSVKVNKYVGNYSWNKIPTPHFSHLAVLPNSEPK
jgi:hypothetical protein